MAAFRMIKLRLCNNDVMFNSKVSLVALRNGAKNIYNSNHATPTPHIEAVVIPKRIKRDPTDVLKALASTVKRNPTSPHYKYEEDPYFLPVSNVNKRSFALSKEAGRKAAAFLLQKYPDSFKHNPAEPNIPAFNSLVELDNSSLGDPQSLKECIDALDIATSVTIYKYLKTKEANLDDEVLQSLLELVCYYGGDECIPENYIEERWMKQSDRERWKKWQPNNIVDEVFLKIKNKTPKSYGILIKGLAKHFQIERAYTLYKEMTDKKFEGDVEVYNKMLLLIPFLREGSDNRWNLVEKFISDMVRSDAKPNLGTFNALLYNVMKLGSWRNSNDLALSILSEMKLCGVEPSLASYYYLLSIYCRDRGPTSYILIDIINQLKDKELEIRHETDINFFVTAMEICNSHLGDPDLALKVHELYQYGKNRKLIGNALKESIYYQNFLKVACKLSDIDQFFALYDTYVPHSYTPEPSVMIDIIEAVDLSGKLSYLPQIWSDAVTFNQANKERIVNAILGTMAKSKDETLNNAFVIVAQDAKERILTQQASDRIIRSNATWTGQILGDLLTIFTNSSDLEKAWDTFKILDNLQATITGYPPNSSLVNYCKLAIHNEEYDRAISCLKYASEIGQVEVIDTIKSVCENMDIKSNFKEEINNLLPELRDEKL